MNDMISNAMIQFREMIDLQKKIQVGEKEYIKDGFKAVLESTIDPIESIHERDDISCSLHEADGAAWKLKAILAIRDYFQDQLPDIPVIA